MIKFNKKETFYVEGVNWKIGIELLMEDFDSLEDAIIEASTRAVEMSYHSNPENFQIGTYVQISLHKQNQTISKWTNSYFILINASMFKMAETIKKYVKLKNNIDIEKQKRIM